MAIPTHDQMLRPLLDLAEKQDLTRRQAQEAMCDLFKLTPEERAQTTPSGNALVIGLRMSWAMTFLTKARLIAKVAKKTYRATEAGRAFLLNHPSHITVKDLAAIEGWKEAWQTKEDATAATAPAGEQIAEGTPLETIESAVLATHSDVRGRLMEMILAQSPEFFERLVLDVLVTMGYGGSREEAAEHLGQSGDEGIDGRINQDALGLDQILVQAKRYAPENPIDRKTIQAFIGSLAGQGVSKGVFITTSYFAKTAEEFVQRGSNTKIVLIDGKKLLDLMLKHKVGIRVERTFEVLEIDQNYFSDED